MGVDFSKGNRIEIFSENLKSYTDIVPTNNMSRQDIQSFISDEFDKVQESHEKADLNSYLTEIFNCSEDEISIPFYITDEIDEVLRLFDIQEWDVLDESDKVSISTEFVRLIAEDLGVEKIPTVSFSDELDADAKYNPLENIIYLNNEYVDDPIEIVESLAHELRHAYQHERAEKLETREDLLFSLNLDYYITPEIDSEGYYINFYDYYDQYVECDARAFASIFREAIE